MNIYFSGIGGVGIGPLAEIASDAGYSVQGSDATMSTITEKLAVRDISISFDQSGDFLRECHAKAPVDWFVYTAALPPNHPELLLAKELGIRTAKRDELLAHIIADKELKLIAIAGTHGKTTTTGMIVWTMKRLGVPVSYSIGTTVSFGPSGMFDPDSKYFVYECDEYDRNLLHFSPHVAVITSIDYDHPDTYPTKELYYSAFKQFIGQASHTIMWHHDNEALQIAPGNAWVLQDDEVLDVALAGAHNRQNATLTAKLIEYLDLAPFERVMAALNSFPGTDRRFERLADNLYTDYGHHPKEIAATLQLAREVSNHVVLVYQPHQNVRQHEVQDQYTDCFILAEEIYWLPTYLSREDPGLSILSPEALTRRVANRSAIHYAQLDENLWSKMEAARAAGKLVLLMGAGDIDGWARQRVVRR